MLGQTMLYIALPALLAGLVQGLVGFGSGFITLMFFPALLGIVGAASVMQCVSVFTCLMMAIQYRKHINFTLIWKPLIFYFPTYLVFIRLLQGVDTAVLSVIMGALMIATSLYYSLPNGGLQIKSGWLTTFVCAALAGAIDAFLGIGGITIIIYLLAVTKDKREFLGTAQFFFLITCAYGTIVRLSRGLLTADMLPYAVTALVMLLLGVLAAYFIVKRINTEQVKKFTYIFIGACGVFVLVKNAIALARR